MATLAPITPRNDTETRLLEGLHAHLGEFRDAHQLYGNRLSSHVNKTLERWAAEGVIEREQSYAWWRPDRYRLTTTAIDPVRHRDALLIRAADLHSRQVRNMEAIANHTRKLADAEATITARSGEVDTADLKAVEAMRIRYGRARDIAGFLHQSLKQRDAIASQIRALRREAAKAGFDPDAIWAGDPGTSDSPEGDPLGGDA